jgi:hypothetical protein
VTGGGSVWLPGESALAIIAGAAADQSLGENAAWAGTATSGSTVSLEDGLLITAGSDQSWRNSWLLVTAVVPPTGVPPDTVARDAIVGSERFVTAVELAAGRLRWTQPLVANLHAGDGYLLLRDFRFARWLGWLNETARQIHYPLDVIVPAGGQQQLRYPLPAPVKRAGWIEEIWVRQAPSDSRAEESLPAGAETRWYRVDTKNVQGDSYLTLARPLSAGQELVFRARPPFAYEEQVAYARWDSVLHPAGQADGDPAVRPPVRLFQMGVTWRALQAKMAPLTGQPRVLWDMNLERFARRYAEACEEWKQKDEQRLLGYREDWYPQGTQTAWSLP